jgi:hypothetical protein
LIWKKERPLNSYRPSKPFAISFLRNIDHLSHLLSIFNNFENIPNL